MCLALSMEDVSNVNCNELPGWYLMFGFGSYVVPAAAAYLGCAVTAKDEEPKLCYYQVYRILLAWTLLRSIVLRTITLLCVVILLMSLPRRGESCCASCASHCAFVDGYSAMPCCVQGVQSGSWCVMNPGMTMYHWTRLVLACMFKLAGLGLQVCASLWCFLVWLTVVTYW